MIQKLNSKHPAQIRHSILKHEYPYIFDTRTTFHENWLYHRFSSNWNIYENYGRKLDRLIDKVKYDYFCKKLDESKDDLKKTWKLINNIYILGRERQNRLLTFPEDDAAHNFNEYFVNVARDLI